MTQITRRMLEVMPKSDNLPSEWVKDELSDFDREIVGKDARITIPLKSKVRLRDVAELLRGLATRLDAISRDPRLTERHALFDAGWESRKTQTKIAELFGRTSKGRKTALSSKD